MTVVLWRTVLILPIVLPTYLIVVILQDAVMRIGPIPVCLLVKKILVLQILTAAAVLPVQEPNVARFVIGIGAMPVVVR